MAIWSTWFEIDNCICHIYFYFVVILICYWIWRTIIAVSNTKLCFNVFMCDQIPFPVCNTEMKENEKYKRSIINQCMHTINLISLCKMLGKYFMIVTIAAGINSILLWFKSNYILLSNLVITCNNILNTLIIFSNNSWYHHHSSFNL